MTPSFQFGDGDEQIRGGGSSSAGHPSFTGPEGDADSGAAGGWQTTGGLNGACATCGQPHGWCSCDAEVQTYAPPQPPLSALLLPAGLALAGIVLALALGNNVVMALLAWIIAGPAAIFAYAAFHRRRVLASASLGYGEPAWFAPVVQYFPILVIVAVAISGWQIADWVARR